MTEVIDDDDDGNDGGYGKPPKKYQFQKGQSGNPKGRKKGTRGLKTDLHKAISTKQTIKINGKTYTGTTQELAMLGLAMRAAAGDLKAQKQLTDLIMAIFGPDDRGGEQAKLSKLDQELLDEFLAAQDEEEEHDDEGSASGEEKPEETEGEEPGDA